MTPISSDFLVRAAAYLGVLFAYLSTAQGDPIMPLQMAILAGACWWSFAIEKRFPRLFLPPQAKVALITVGAAVFIFFLFRHLHGGGDVARPVARFLFWNAIVFVLSRDKTEYDLWTLAIIDLSLFMVSGAFVHSAGFVPLFSTCLLANLVVFARLALLRCGPAGRQDRSSVPTALLQFAAVLATGAALFLFFPRTLFRAAPGAPRPRPNRAAAAPALPPRDGSPPVATGDERRSGIPKKTDLLALTNLGSIKLDRTPVLHLEVLSPEAEAGRLRYLRGAVLDRYERGEWTAKFAPRAARRVNERVWELSPPRYRDGTPVECRIRLEPVAGDLLFAFAEPFRVGAPEVRHDPAGTLFLKEPAKEAVVYEVLSLLPPARDLDRIGETAAEARYLQLPSGLDAVRELARRRAAGARTRKRKLDALLAHFREEKFSYRLAPFVPADGLDPVDHFLTRKKEGSCVHFATALALLARAAGIPCRLVTGFHVHEYDPARKRFVVRNSDAHAWVEVDFGDAGWVAVDPTPAEESAPAAGDPVASGAKDPGGRAAPEDAGEARRWDAFLVEYGTGEQRGLFGGVGEAADRILRRLVRPAVGLVLLAVLAVAGGAYFILPARGRRRFRQWLEGSGEASSVDFYRDFLWILARRGLRKPPGQTGREFARAAQAACGEAGIDTVTERFYRVRYAGEALTTDERGEVEEILERLARRSAEREGGLPRRPLTPSGSASSAASRGRSPRNPGPT
ncbi:MAG: DUF3488 domain-containing protein [Planctomycetes bacterium]|nr:DUF3488 domain-containing protein [Planctomycetota bacterium]